jgi:hypothetical protein
MSVGDIGTKAPILQVKPAPVEKKKSKMSYDKKIVHKKETKSYKIAKLVEEMKPDSDSFDEHGSPKSIRSKKVSIHSRPSHNDLAE